MIYFLLSLMIDPIGDHRPGQKSASRDTGASHRSLRLAPIPCPAAPATSRQIRLLPDYNLEAGHHEKNVNQCNSGRGVANGDGRWPAPLRSEYRVTV
jgi:hypothetical protein